MAGIFQPSATRPADLEAFWSEVDAELARVEAVATLDPNPNTSTEFAASYSLYLTSAGPYRLYAYYNVPRGDGPFPAILHTPSYMSVVTQTPYEERRKYVSMALCARGQRLSDRPHAARFPGLAVDGVEAALTYVYRGIIADTLRAIDFLFDGPEVDTRR